MSDLEEKARKRLADPVVRAVCYELYDTVCCFEDSDKAAASAICILMLVRMGHLLYGDAPIKTGDQEVEEEILEVGKIGFEIPDEAPTIQ